MKSFHDNGFFLLPVLSRDIGSVLSVYLVYKYKQCPLSPGGRTVSDDSRLLPQPTPSRVEDVTAPPSQKETLTEDDLGTETPLDTVPNRVLYFSGLRTGRTGLGPGEDPWERMPPLLVLQ